MNLLKRKILLAPILAVALAFLLAGSVSFLPENASQGQPMPQATSVPTSIVPIPTAVPQAAGVTATGGIFSIVFAVAAVLVGVVAAFLLFSEKNLNKEID